MFIEALLEAVFEAVFTIVIEAFKAPGDMTFPIPLEGLDGRTTLKWLRGRCHRIPFGTATSMALEESNITMHWTRCAGR